MRVSSLAFVAVLVGVTVTLVTGCNDVVGPTTGSIRITVTTVGADLDPDGYSVTVDGGVGQAIGTTGTITIPDLPPNDHVVRLDGAAANCPVDGANPRAVTVVAGAAAEVAFAVVCTAFTGSLRVTTATTGTDPDPDGYSVSVDGGAGLAIGTNGAVTLASLSLGDHVVRLDGVAANCPVDGANPRPVTVVAGATADVPFAVACTAFTGSVRVTTATTGTDPDPDGYSVSVDGGAGLAIGTNGAVALANLSLGDHVVRLDGVAANCRVDGANPRPVTVVAGATADVAFAIACSAPLVFTSVSAGYSYSCGVTTGGAAYCWGSSSYGQLGDGSTTHSATPAAVAGGLTFTSVSAGVFHTCGITTPGAAYCWGPNSSGELGDGTTTDRASPVAVMGGLSFAAMSTGFGHTCGLTTDGAAYCWGDNQLGQLGTGDLTGSPTPLPVSGGLTFRSLNAGWYYTCGVTTGGTGYCWGSDGALGYSATELCGWDDATPGPLMCSKRPAAVQGGRSFAQVGTGEHLTCGLTTDGAAYCWGSYPAGTWSIAPVAVPGGLTFAGLSVDAARSCGVATGGGADCWGWIPVAPYQGEFSDAPTAVPGGLTFAAVSVGWFHTCGVTPGGTAYCWGGNRDGELGDGSLANSLVPVKVAGQP